MKGFELNINDNIISGGIENGLTGIVISCRENKCQLDFSSLDHTGMISSIWYSSILKLGDKIMIKAVEINHASAPAEIRDYKDKELMNKIDLDSYYRMRKELVSEGLIK